MNNSNTDTDTDSDSNTDTDTIHTRIHTWPKIHNFLNMRTHTLKYPHFIQNNSIITFKAKIKLHGTYAGIMISNKGIITTLSRSRIITPENDNANFANWVSQHSTEFIRLTPQSGSIILNGEWCGPGIQKGTAVNQLPKHIFAIFAIHIIDNNEYIQNLLIEPEDILPFTKNIPDSYAIPWFDNNRLFNINLLNTTPLQNETTINDINQCITEIDDCDPWLLSQFNISGTGEGLVFYPINTTKFKCSNYQFFANLCFKAKGEKHKITGGKKTKSVQFNPDITANINELVLMLVTEDRVLQATNETSQNNNIFNIENIGSFLHWINLDIIKEATSEIQASGLPSKLVLKACSHRARNLYLKHTKS